MNKVEKQLRALVLLSGMEYSEVHTLPNGYDSRGGRDDPWLLFIVKGGTFTLGWRKRVINVEWTVADADPITEEDQKWITHSLRNFHAWGYAQALHFLIRVVDQQGNPA